MIGNEQGQAKAAPQFLMMLTREKAVIQVGKDEKKKYYLLKFSEEKVTLNGHETNISEFLKLFKKITKAAQKGSASGMILNKN